MPDPQVVWAAVAQLPDFREDARPPAPELLDDGQIPLNEGGRAPTLESYEEVFIGRRVALMM